MTKLERHIFPAPNLRCANPWHGLSWIGDLAGSFRTEHSAALQYAVYDDSTTTRRKGFRRPVRQPQYRFPTPARRRAQGGRVIVALRRPRLSFSRAQTRARPRAPPASRAPRWTRVRGRRASNPPPPRPSTRPEEGVEMDAVWEYVEGRTTTRRWKMRRRRRRSCGLWRRRGSSRRAWWTR